MNEKNYIKKEYLLNQYNEEISKFEIEDLKNFQKYLIDKHSEFYTDLNLLHLNYIKHIKILTEFLKENTYEKNFKFDDFIIIYNVVDNLKLIKNKNIENFKLMIKWNIDNDNNLYLVNGIKIIINHTCYYTFNYDINENKLLLTQIGVDSNYEKNKFLNINENLSIYEPGNFLNNVMDFINKLEFNYGTIKIFYTKKDEIKINIKNVIYKSENICVLSKETINIKNTLFKIFNNLNEDNLNEYYDMSNEIFTLLNKNLLNIDFNENTLILEKEIEGITKNTFLENEIKEIFQKYKTKNKTFSF